MSRRWLREILLCSSLAGCAGSALYPARPPSMPGEARADATPSRFIVHATISRPGLEALLDELIPKKGEGVVPILGSDRHYAWTRQPLAVELGQGRVSIRTHIDVSVALLVEHSIGIDLRVTAEPIVSADYGARLQSVIVEVGSSDRRMKLAQSLGGALDAIESQISGGLKAFRYDLKPVLVDAYARVSRPIEFTVGGARGCARFELLGVEAGPTQLADGIEKDLAFLIAPSITFPCAEATAVATLPPLQNVAALATGAFTVTMPVAARYEELERAMTLAFTDGKLYFSKDLPRLYLEKPEIYPSKDELIVKLHLAGRVDRGGIHTSLDGDLFLRGHPQVVDNELRIPDLQPTIDTSSFLLKLAAAIDGDTIRDQARAALRLDLGARIAEARDRLSLDIPIPTGAAKSGPGCVRAVARRIELTGVYPHAHYLRVYLQIVGQAALSVPCLEPAAAQSRMLTN